jgi:hypothetical protein
MRGSISPFRHTPSWRGAYVVKPRDNFPLLTFTRPHNLFYVKIHFNYFLLQSPRQKKDYE